MFWHSHQSGCMKQNHLIWAQVIIILKDYNYVWAHRMNSVSYFTMFNYTMSYPSIWLLYVQFFQSLFTITRAPALDMLTRYQLFFFFWILTVIFVASICRTPLPDSVKSVLEEGINLYQLHTQRFGRYVVTITFNEKDSEDW